MQPIRNADVEITSGFWKNRQELNRNVTLYAVRDRFADTGRFAAMDCRWREGMPNKPHIFWDSDIAKWMESVAYAIEKQPMPDLEAYVEGIIDKIEANQTAEGYFNTYFISVEPSMRWQNRSWHELYCAGHLMEAAVAWKRATGRDRFLRMMRRYADYIDRVFRIEGSAAFATPGHEEIELALVKLYDATGEKKYLDLSAWFVSQRGIHAKDDRSNSYEARGHQDYLPCALQTTAEGHAVRACYLYSAMADIARTYGNAELRNACVKIFDNIANRRMYITAGIGSTHCSEAFTIDYDLPNQTAYTETCASIALAFFAQRMLMLEKESKYADMVERVLYNGFLSSTSLDGKRFYYSNPMEIEVAKHDAHPSSEKGDWLPRMEREEVFGCSCCPPNITRFVASIGEYAYGAEGNAVYVHQYMGSNVRVLGGRLSMETEYPNAGDVAIHAEWLAGKKLYLRIPYWCGNFTLNKAYTMENGYAVVECAQDDENILLQLEIKPMLIQANPNVADAAGKVALQRGAVVYCMEGLDNPCIFDCMVDAKLSATEEYHAEYGMPILYVKGWKRPEPKEDWLYKPFDGILNEVTLTFIPYYAMQNRGIQDMRVWIPVQY